MVNRIGFWYTPSIRKDAKTVLIGKNAWGVHLGESALKSQRILQVITRKANVRSNLSFLKSTRNERQKSGRMPR